MTQYGSPEGDKTIAFVLGFFLFLAIVLGVVFAITKEPTTATVKQEPAKIEQVKEPELPAIKEETVIKEEKKEEPNCAYWQTMYFMNVGKQMQTYYFIMWNSCKEGNL